MAQHVITVKVEHEALRLLRRIAAETGERQYVVMRRLLVQEARKLGLPTKEGEG